MAQDLTLLRHIQMESFFGVPQKLKCNEQYENSDAFTLNLHVFLLN